MDCKRIKFCIESKLENVSLIGVAINKLCSLIPLSDAEAYRIELCAVEAVNNSIIHAYGDDATHEVEVIFTLYSDRVTLEVCDTGTPMDQDCLKKATILPFENDSNGLDNVQEGGRGLPIIKEVMDSVVYETKDGKNCFTMMKKTRS